MFSRSVLACLIASAAALAPADRAAADGAEAFVGGLLGSAIGTAIVNRPQQQRGHRRAPLRDQARPGAGGQHLPARGQPAGPDRAQLLRLPGRRRRRRPGRQLARRDRPVPGLPRLPADRGADRVREGLPDLVLRPRHRRRPAGGADHGRERPGEPRPAPRLPPGADGGPRAPCRAGARGGAAPAAAAPVVEAAAAPAGGRAARPPAPADGGAGGRGGRRGAGRQRAAELPARAPRRRRSTATATASTSRRAATAASSPPRR